MPDSPHEPSHDPEPDLSPEQAQEVRRLLADARHSEPIPTDVAARLDRVLAELRSQGADSTHDEEGASVVALASRRRRRVVSVLVAAAAVVAVGVGLDQLMYSGGVGSSSDSMPAADRSQVTGGSAGADAPQSHHRPHSSYNADKGQGDSVAATPKMAVADVVRIRADHFSADVGRARRLTRNPAEEDSTHGMRDTRGTPECTPGDWGRGTFVPVRYDGHRGVLVLRRPSGDSQVADVFSCGSSDVLRSITLPAR